MRVRIQGLFQIFSLILALSFFLSAQSSIITTVAGAHLGNHKPALSADFGNLISVAIDKEGNLYLSDNIHCQIRRVGKNGLVTRFAGGDTCGFSGDGGEAKSALLSHPFGIALDAEGSLLIDDAGNARIRKVSASGKITTVAGNGIFGYSGDGGPATEASLAGGEGVFGDASSNIYIADSGNNVIRLVDKEGLIHTVAGTQGSGFPSSGDGGPATSASIVFPVSVIADNQGSFYVADSSGLVRKVDSTGTITTFAGNGQFPLNTGSGGPATAASIGQPLGLLISGGKLFISTNTNIWAVGLNDQIANIIAGTGVQGFGGDGQPALSATFNDPWGMAANTSGDLIVADAENGRARKISHSTQTVSTIAGGFLGDGGPAVDSGLEVVQGGGIGFDASGNLYIADSQNNRVRKVSTDGTITTFAGTGISNYSGDGGPASSASLSDPTAVAVDSGGNVFIADAGNGVVRKVDTNGTISTFARPGLGLFGNVFAGLAVDGAGNVYASDGIFDVWKTDPSGNFALFAGTQFGIGFNGDGIPATQAELNFPAGLAVDHQGNVFIAEWFGPRVRKVDTNGIISTVAGNGASGFNGDGILATAASLFEPTDVALDAAGNLYISDWINLRVRMVDSSGIIHTFAGTGNQNFNGDGLPASQTNISPTSVAVSPQGLIYMTDEGSFRVRRVEP